MYPRHSSDFARADTTRKPNIKQRLILQLEHENGGMLPNNPEIKERFKDIYYNGLNLKVGWQSDRSDDIYQQLYNYPIYGIGFYASTFGLESIGKPWAVYGFVAIPISPRFDSRWNFNYRISLGLSGNFNPYNQETNPVNTLVGSHKNAFIDVGFQTNYRLTQHFQVGAGLAFHHFSNGSLVQPNKGINLIPFTVAVTYIPSTQEPDFSKGQVPHLQPNNQFHLQIAAGVKEFKPDDRQQFFKSTLGAYWSHSLGYKWRLGAGMDVFYSSSGNYTRFAGEQEGKFGSLFSVGTVLYIDHVLTHNLYLNGNVGYYLHHNEFNGELQPYYLRIGIRRNVFRDFFVGMSIKAHKGKADYIEWTTGYTFGR